MTTVKTKTTIGRLERISLPEFGLNKIVAKIDTGAYRGCIHTEVLGEIERDGKTYLQFKLLGEKDEVTTDQVFETAMFNLRSIRSSNGGMQQRYVITTKIIMGDRELNINLGLDNRASMRHPLILGRKILSGRFIVDVRSKFLLG